MILLLAGFFVSITLFVLGISFLIYKVMASPQRRIIKRVNEFYPKEVLSENQVTPFLIREDSLSKLPVFDRILTSLDIGKKLHRLLQQADSKLRPGDLILLMLGFGFFGLILSLMFTNVLIKGIIILLLGALPLIRVNMQRQTRLKAFIRGFPDALDMMTSAIRAGHALNQAIQLVGQEAPDPIGPEFKTTFEQHNLGLNIREALLNLSERVGSLDLKLFVTAILLQRETGGNLTEVLEKISYTIRERFKLIGQIKTFTAQGRMSAWLLGTLPIIFVVLISLLNPDYLRPLTHDKIGHYLILIASILQVIGFSVIRKIVLIKYQ